MEKLILFDIDYTLLKNAVSHRTAFIESVKETYGLDTNLEKISYIGLTDQQILVALLKEYGLPEGEILRKAPAFMEKAAEVFLNIIGNDRSIRLLDGVRDLIREMDQRGFLLGLVTGNIKQIARGKLVKFGLWHYFKVGGFGCDHPERAALVNYAVQRAENNFNFTREHNVFLFGDTANDIDAGKTAGVFTFGVATGSCSPKDLAEAGATYVLDNLKDTGRIIDLINSK